MAKLSVHKDKQAQRAKRFGVWIENRMIQVAIATPLDAARYRIEIDHVKCPTETGWLRGVGEDAFRGAIDKLVERHDMRRGHVAVSLDGDFCVSRIALGNAAHVDHEIRTLASRVPRYLQLGPGRKAMGHVRSRVDNDSDHALTSVVNRSLISAVYDAFRKCEVELAYAEPSLVSLARLVGKSDIYPNKPILIADGTGMRWDVGIVHEGRLILDYRPAAATSEEEFHTALDGHISRLHRFCHRHLGIHVGQLDRMVICGAKEKVDRTVALFANSEAIKAEPFLVPSIDSLYELSDHHHESQFVPAVASVLPLMMEINEKQIPDLLSEVRREPDRSFVARFLVTAWPAIAATIILLIGYGMLVHQRNTIAQMQTVDTEAKATVIATNTRVNQLSQSRQLLNYFGTIRSDCREPDWNLQLERIGQSLPDEARLNEFRIEEGRSIRIEGSVAQQQTVYEVLEQLHDMPLVAEAALLGTSPETNSNSTRFVIRLTMVDLTTNEVTNENQETESE